MTLNFLQQSDSNVETVILVSPKYGISQISGLRSSLVSLLICLVASRRDPPNLFFPGKNPQQLSDFVKDAIISMMTRHRVALDSFEIVAGAPSDAYRSLTRD